MTPIYKVVVNGSNITELIKTRLLSIQITDEAGFDSDTVNISLDDRDGKIDIPKLGVEMEVWLGYKESGLVNIGKYTIDEVGLSGMPETMTIRGKAASMTGEDSVKSQKTRSWKNTTLGAIVEKVANEHKLKAKVDVELKSIYIKDLAQTDESNMHLLTRIAEDYGAVLKVSSGNLILKKKSGGKTVGGETMPPIILNRIDVKSGYRVTIAEREAYKSVSAKYHDKGKAKLEKVTVGSGEPSKTLRHPYDSKDQAEKAAKAEMESSSRSTAKLSLPLAIGNPKVAAETIITLNGFRDGIAGDWNVTNVSHTWSNSGASTSLNAESI